MKMVNTLLYSHFHSSLQQDYFFKHDMLPFLNVDGFLLCHVQYFCLVWSLVVSVGVLKNKRRDGKGFLSGKGFDRSTVESHVNAMTQMTNPFFGGWLGGQKIHGFCRWSVEEEEKENTLSDVEELLNANWIHSFTFQFGPVQKYKIHLQKYKIHWEIEKKKQRKILSMTWKNYSMPTGLGLTLLYFNLGHIGLGS